MASRVLNPAPRSPGLLASLAATCALAFAQNPPPPDEKLAAVEGEVTNSVTGAPLARVQVRLTENTHDGGQVYGGSTGADGKFSIGSIPKGIYTVTAQRTGYLMPAARDGRRAFDLTLQPGDKRDDLAVKLIPTGAISGRVAGVDGVPIEGSNVVADDGSGDGPSSTTDANGNFRIGGLAPGKYRVRAGPEFVPFQPEVRTDGTEQIHYSPTYFPDSLEPGGATRVAVGPDSEAGGIAIHLVRTPNVCVRGAVVGMPRDAYASLQIGRKGKYIVAGVGRDGTFQVWNLDPGSYLLFANVNRNGQRLRTTIANVELADKSIDHVEVRMLPPAAISGRVDYDNERAKAPAETLANPPVLRLLAAIPGPRPDPAIVHDDGSFQLTGILPGLYRVSVSWPGVFVSSIRSGSYAVEGGWLDFRDGVSAAPLSVLVSSALGEVTGVVSDGNGPVAGARVVLAFEDPNAERPSVDFTTADAGGNYRFGNLAPGKYRLAAVDDGDAVVSKGVLDDYQYVLAEIEIHPSDKLTQNLTRHTASK